MSKNYTQSTASLKTVTLDTFVLDAQKIMVYPGEGNKTTRVNLIDAINDTENKISNVSLVINDVAGEVSELETTINSLGDTYVSKNDYNSFVGTVNDSISAINTTIDSLGSTYVTKDAYNSFVTSTNNSISTINTSLGKCAKSNEANVFTATNNFQGTTVFATGDYNITIDNKGLRSYYPITSDMGFVTEGILQVLPLNTTTITGQDAYGISVTPPSADGKSGGLQLWGVQFTQGDEWSNNALKIVHNELALFGNHQAPCSLTFDNANVVNFRVMPDDGSTANNGQGAIFDFAAWQWDDESHTTKNANCPVQILKNDSGSLTGRSLMNMNEMDNRYVTLTNLSSNYYNKSETENNFYNKTASDSRYLKLNGDSQSLTGNTLTVYSKTTFFNDVDVFHLYDKTASPVTEPSPERILNTRDNDYRYAQLKVENIFEEVNNFEKHVNFGSSVETNGTVKVNSGGVVLSADGYVSFNDDGLVTTPSGAKGYPYSEGIPTVLSNGGVYNLGMITEPIDLSGVYFDGDDTIIQTCEVWFEQGSTVNAITWMPDLYWIDTANGKAPTWIAKLRYRVAIRKEIDRLIGSVSYSYSI